MVLLVGFMFWLDLIIDCIFIICILMDSRSEGKTIQNYHEKKSLEKFISKKISHRNFTFSVWYSKDKKNFSNND